MDQWGIMGKWRGRFRRTAIVAAASVFLVGCAQYKLVGSFDGFNEYFVGDLNHNLVIGRADIVVTGQNSGIVCRGHSEVTHVPAFSVGCAGQRGVAVMSCDDGRTVDADWEATSCTSGKGRGVDDTGARVRFSFGQNEAQARADLEAAGAQVAGKPELPVYRPDVVRAERGFATGTGFVVDPGLLLTNFHVVDGAKSVSLIVGEAEVPARVVATDPDSDLALVEADIDASPLAIAPPGAVRVGDEVAALGYPAIGLYGQTQRATFGRVNALRGLGDHPLFLQMDAGIQPGNSGGPLLDASGRVVGVVTATASISKFVATIGTMPQNANFAVQTSFVHQFMSRARPSWRSQGQGRGAGSMAEMVARSEDSVLIVVSR